MAIEQAPKFARSWVVLWILSIFPLAVYLLAGFNVARFYDLWNSGWDGLLAAIGVAMGMKFGKDTLIRKAELNANVAAGSATPTDIKAGYSTTGSD